MYFVGNNCKTASRFSGRVSLNRSVEREDVGLVGNTLDDFDDIADFLRAFAQALDQRAGFLNVTANVVHTVDGITHLLRAFTRDAHGIVGNFCRITGTSGDAVE